MNATPLVSSNEIRSRFSRAMSTMYRDEVPQYGALLELVASVNRRVLDDNPQLREQMQASGEVERLDVERHGAIRVGTAEELAMLRRLFAVMGMYPVGYYDLSQAGVPVHSTAFRPIGTQALKANPFRVFTSLLRLDLIDDEALRAQAAEILAQRDIFTREARELIDLSEAQGGLTDEQAELFVEQALETFRWHHQATVELDTYDALHEEHRLIADVVCFRGPHINHLTPRTLDIDEAQRRMPDYGMNGKEVIEGPPRRHHGLLLRQTSFKALDESIYFLGEQPGTHTARFGEIEQRGMALTPKGRKHYDQLLKTAREKAANLDSDGYERTLGEVFEAFPDDLDTLRREQLAYFHYAVSDKASAQGGSDMVAKTLDSLIEEGLITATPIIYEDFLPVSAAGIFQSNLGEESRSVYAGSANQAAFERALGTQVNDEFTLYAKQQDDSHEEAMASIVTLAH